MLSTAVYAAQFNVIARCWLRTECLRCPRGPSGFIEICTISAGIVFSDSSPPGEGCAFSSNVFYMNHRRTGEVVRVGEPGDQLHPRWLGFKGARDRSLWRRRRAPPIGNTGAERLGDKGPWAGRDNPAPRARSSRAEHPRLCDEPLILEFTMNARRTTAPQRPGSTRGISFLGISQAYRSNFPVRSCYIIVTAGRGGP